MILAALVVIVSLAILVWSADRFVEGSSATARHFGIAPLLIGMVIVGFGTSAPELMVSAIAAWQDNPGLALGNAYGSNISNIALILGVTALICPIAFHSQILRRELPILALVTGLAAFQIRDGELTRLDALILLGAFAALMTWTVRQALRRPADNLAVDVERELESNLLPLGKAVFWLVVGLVLLIASSRSLVWGAVQIARGFGVDDLIVGLTVVAIGTSLPELASSVMATRKNEHDLALGNVIGSNLFNTLVAVGIAGVIRPFAAAPEVNSRDIPVMVVLTLSLFAIGWGIRGPGRINRIEGALLVTAYVAYTGWLVAGVLR